ncbi:PREDICTED: 39S ribosomal protein L55, mitochondrial-like [Branchiostoma belcheri]|uniref:39S ribosomal protein L55, mitochondrial-like n=1 Tax=Branchiostoma belcheri TaxID=7741 RepID=A0A6P4Z901_BRABE|nr:PREDICTED: 39S ribosomal protein L55, mitochondrial-like [Branchiostoma belcheri]
MAAPMLRCLLYTRLCPCGSRDPVLLSSVVHQVRHNSNRTTIARLNRTKYARTYNARVVQPDGSTITVPYKEPIGVIKMPLDIDSLSDQERRLRMAKRMPKQVQRVEEEFEDDFDAKRYSHLFKKK